jgi:hypothetical protein
MKDSRVRLALYALVALLGVSWLGAFIITPRFPPLPQLVPIRRLIANAERTVREQPESAAAHYTLARLHYLVFSTGWTMVEERHDGIEVSVQWDGKTDLWATMWRKADELAYEDLGITVSHVPESKRNAFEKARKMRHTQLVNSKWTPATSLPAAVMADHAAQALEGLEAAAHLDGSNAHYVLCQACLVEQVVEWRSALNLKKIPAKLEGLDSARARDLFLRAFRVGSGKPAPGGRCASVDHTATLEAGKGFLRLLNKSSAAAGDETLARAREEVSEGMKQFAGEEVYELVTPIVLSLSGRQIDDLIEGSARVSFNLAGFGPARTWPWLKPAAGLLVWDPQRTGEIVSGRQLFGSFTFQIAWTNGYDALAALDDDGDGILRGAELDGIRVWFDRNSDGISTPEEVVDLADCGIVGIAVKADGMAGIHPTNSRGLLLADGRTLPTWDWMAEPIRK